MSRVMTRQHIWVKHTITPVSVIANDEGEPIIFVDPDQQTIAEDQAVYGCNVCNQPMATHHDTECEGPDDA